MTDKKLSVGGRAGMWVACLAAAVALCAVDAARAATYEVHSGEDLISVLQSLVAGDECIVYDGTYTRSGYVLLDWQGTAQNPIIVRAADGNRPRIDGDASQNNLNIAGQFFEFKGFEMTGGSHGIRLENVHDALFEDLEIHQTAGVALSANRSGHEYYNNTFRYLHLHHTAGNGEGMYLGCNYGDCVFHDNLIENCWIHDTSRPPNPGAQGDGIEIKDGSYGNTVRDNVIYNTYYPCIIVYGTYDNPRNIVENNVMWNCDDGGIQAAAEAVLRNNIIFNAGNGINSHTHQNSSPHDLTIVNNTVVGATDRCLRSSDWGGSTGIIVANNAFYCDGGNAVRIASGGGDIVFTNNVVVGNVEGVSSGFINGNSSAQDLTDVANHDAWPTDTSPLIDGADPAHAPVHDFNWTVRGASPDVGAYEWQSGGNPGWDVGEGFKQVPDGGAPPVPDAAPGADGSGPRPDGSTSTDGGGPQPDGSNGSGGSGKGGCKCNLSSGEGGTPLPLLIFLAVMCLAVRRRK